jgi:hypothetical protein
MTDAWWTKDDAVLQMMCLQGRTGEEGTPRTRRLSYSGHYSAFPVTTAVEELQDVVGVMEAGTTARVRVSVANAVV